MTMPSATLEWTEHVRRADERFCAALAALLPRMGAHLSGTNAQRTVDELRQDYKEVVEELLAGIVELNDGLWWLYAALVAFRSLAGQGVSTLDQAFKSGDGQKALDWALEEICWPNVVDRQRLEGDIASQKVALPDTGAQSLALEDLIEDLESFLVKQPDRMQLWLDTLGSPAIQKEFPLAANLYPHCRHLHKRLEHEKAAIRKLGALLS